ncbi:STAS domain-containing protein [Paractinoplanes rishiriensis]|uniref:Anti-anti-sigma factor n=1 Tax=Paractinoplanes rishiriensis TaxID=1050105 RepID=A0A919K2S0_9ACTN|nr:STAS domain-containing protein [Actinoplanes rishiriensis]GIE97563.1 anti-anti-sigma factor [Actinoplanes rishiriensis]
MSTALTCHTARRPDGTLVLTAAGEVDMSNAASFAEALTAARSDAPEETLVVDLTRVEYLDSAGLAALFPHVDHLRLVAGPLLAPVLTIAGLDDLTTLQESH